MMRIRVNPFPVIYYSVICEKHQCKVHVRHVEADRRDGQWASAGRMTAISCEKAGTVDETDCMDRWVMTINGGGDVTITN